jgi:hypothetical protein
MRLIQRLIFNQEAFKGATWGQHFTGCKPGTQSTRTPNWRWREVYKKEKILNRLGPWCLFLINHYRWGHITCTKSIRSAPLPSLTSFAAKGSHRDRSSSSFFFCEFFSDGLSFQQKQIGKNGRKLNR